MMVLGSKAPNLTDSSKASSHSLAFSVNAIAKFVEPMLSTAFKTRTQGSPTYSFSTGIICIEASSAS